MSKEEFEKLKLELKEELKKELNYRKDKGTTYWSQYSEEITKKLKEKGYKQTGKAISALTYWARVITDKYTVIKLTQEDMKKVRPVIDEIINIIPDLTIA